MRQVRVWPAGAIAALENCFECTDWDMFKAAATYNRHTQVGEYAESVSAYNQKCMEDICVIKNITTRANEKPWMDSEVRAMMKACNVTFKSGDVMALRTSRANLNRATRIAKRAHAQKAQNFFHDPTNTRRMWQAIQVITDYKPTPPSP